MIKFASDVCLLHFQKGFKVVFNRMGTNISLCNIKTEIKTLQRSKKTKMRRNRGWKQRQQGKKEPPVKYHAARPASCGLIVKQP